jgi:UDP-N-acetylglucosamine 2-epimerase (non-hydrolysing)
MEHNMQAKKVMVIFGTRPEATKMCTVVKELKKYPERFKVKVVVTGQHKKQLYQVLQNFNIKPDIDLGLMKEDQSLSYVTTSAISGLDNVVQEDKPDFILVHGDTMTSFCGALVGFFHKIPVGHIEAGLRSFEKYSPWPEEVNRRLVDVVADLLFAPTALSCENLMKEGYKREQIYITGQTAIDASLNTYQENHVFSEQALNKIDFKHRRVITMTAHRKENYGEPMRQMFTAIRRLAEDNPDVLIVYPVHLSPTVREMAYRILSGHDRILLLEPIDFVDSINLQARSYFIMSDSGGLQEECVVFHKPLVLMRDTTERPEAIEAGAVYLAGTDEAVIYDISTKLLRDTNFYSKMAGARNPFGDGKASERIAQILSKYFGFITDLPEEFV